MMVSLFTVDHLACCGRAFSPCACDGCAVDGGGLRVGPRAVRLAHDGGACGGDGCGAVQGTGDGACVGVGVGGGRAVGLAEMVEGGDGVFEGGEGCVPVCSLHVFVAEPLRQVQNGCFIC